MVDAKSLMGAFAISQAADINLIIHENPWNLENDIILRLTDFISTDRGHQAGQIA